MTSGGSPFLTSPLHVESLGSGDPPVVLVHGLGAHGHSWRKWVPALTARHRVHVLDLMGFGRAAAPAGGDYSVRAQAGRLVEFLRRLDGSPPVLVGHSLGAAVILLAALRLRDEGGAFPLAGLVIVSGAVYPQKLPPFISLARRPVLGEIFLVAPPPHRVLRRAIQGIVHDPKTVDRDQVEGYREPLRSFRRRWAALRAARQVDPREGELLAPRLQELFQPALLVWGREDRIIRPEMGERMAKDLRRARLVLLEAVGHLPPEEAPEASLEPVLEFLERDVRRP